MSCSFAGDYNITKIMTTMMDDHNDDDDHNGLYDVVAVIDNTV